MANNDYFILYSCCIPVEGASRSLVCDLQRGTYYFIPNALCEILKDVRNKTVSAIKAEYDHQYDDVIDEYFAFLSKNELGFWCDDPALFPPLDLSWESPVEIANAIIDIDHTSTHDFSRVFEGLSKLGCKSLQLRFFAAVSGKRLEEILNLLENSPLRSIELFLPYSDEWQKKKVERLMLFHQLIFRVYIHSAPFTRQYPLKTFAKTIFYTRERLESAGQCGWISPQYFSINMDCFTEAREYNTCLNKKIAVDVQGNIKNCPSMKKAFGNIKDVALADVLKNPEFKKLWTINKDTIEVCKDCEFRYFCVDCRAFLCDGNNPHSKPLKCRYNPYEAAWQ
jgi:SPASM domain peptide maturase of grasp-with-spasm system